MSQVQASGSAGKKTVPVWSLFLVAILVLGSVLGAFMVDPQLVNALSPKPTPPVKDFTLTSSLTSLSIGQGSSEATILTVASVNGFDNGTGLSVAMPADAAGVLTSTLDSVFLRPSSGGKANSTLTVSAADDALTGSYVLTVTGTTGTKTHGVQLTVGVSSVPDFTITSSFATMNVPRNGANTTTLTLTSRNGFSGDISLSVSAPFAFLGVAGGVSPLFLASNGSNSTMLAVSASGNVTAIGTYYIIVTGTGGIVSRSIIVTVRVVNAVVSGGVESLSLDSYAFNSGTNVTLFVRNRGTVSVSLVTYYVKDSSGNQYANTAWSGPTISPNAVAQANVLIGSGCGSCTLFGTAFTFTAGNSYTIVFVTARTNQFSFTITR